MVGMPNCAYLPCSEPFTPTRKNQRFCLKATGRDSCRYKYHHAHRRNDPHACPWCSVWHDPEEPAVLDVLERLIRDQSWPTARDQVRVVSVADLQALIDHRRAILAAGQPAPAIGEFALTDATQMS